MFPVNRSGRSHALTEAGAVLSLKNIAEGASSATRERLALCFRRLATEPLNRGLIVQQGGLVRSAVACAELSRKCPIGSMSCWACCVRNAVFGLWCCGAYARLWKTAVGW